LEVTGHGLASIPGAHTLIKLGDHCIFARYGGILAIIQVARNGHQFVRAFNHTAAILIVAKRRGGDNRVLMAARTIVRHKAAIGHTCRRTGTSIARVNCREARVARRIWSNL
jgi:hypothetical protein